jgi:hypothetical protein
MIFVFKTTQGAKGISAKPTEAPKAPEFNKAFPFRQGEDHERYSLEAALDAVFDHQPKETVLFFETSFIRGQEAIEVVEEHPIGNTPFRMSRTVHSCHSRSCQSRNG